MHRSQRRPFTTQENNFIKESVKLIGEEWEIISRVLPGRTPKQIHDRYINYLADGLRSEPWTKEEDEIIIRMYNKIGPKWSKMTTEFEGRSPNDIKNRWHKHLIKKNPELIERKEISDQNEEEEKTKEEDKKTKTTFEFDDHLFDLMDSIIHNIEDKINEIIDDFHVDFWNYPLI